MTYLDRLRQVVSGEAEPPPIAKFVGFRLVEVEEGRSVIEFEAAPRHWNPQGTLHGGIMCDIADAAMGIAYASTLPEDVSFTTIELKINFLRPVKTGRLQAVGHVVKAGRTIGLTECDLTDAEGRLVARASSTCMTLRNES
ncbi:MAG: PaaI family thioesterase [Chloroflexota bacterium]